MDPRTKALLDKLLNRLLWQMADMVATAELSRVLSNTAQQMQCWQAPKPSQPRVTLRPRKTLHLPTYRLLEHKRKD